MREKLLNNEQHPLQPKQQVSPYSNCITVIFIIHARVNTLIAPIQD